MVDNESFCQLMQKYIKSLKTKMKIDNLSLNTIDTYTRTYKQFVEFCEEYDKELTLHNIKEADIYAFIEYKSDRLDKQGDASISSINSYISHLKKLFNHISRNSEEPFDFTNVFEDIKLKQPQRIPKGISDKDFTTLLNFLENLKQDENFVNIRNVLLMKLLMFGGLRASEAISVKLSNITLDEENSLYKISFVGKGRKNRVTYIGHDHIEDEISILKSVFKVDENSPIALSRLDSVMSRIQLSKMVNSIYRRAGLKLSGVHILRHTAAKRLLSAGVSIAVVQSLLGHASIQTTAIYANPTESIIKNELKNV